MASGGRNGPGIALSLLVVMGTARAAMAGGAWVPPPGKGEIQLGLSRKMAHTSWDSGGRTFTNLTRDGTGRLHYHDFRYGYLAGEVGVIKGLSARFLLTYLHGLEGPEEDLEKNAGFSDAWLGLKYQVRRGELPMAVALTLRTPYLYDLPGPYSRHLFDSNGQFRGVSPEWRGLLKEDYTLSYLVSRSYAEGRGWFNLEAGYTWRTGAPADQIPVLVDLGIPLPVLDAAVKGGVLWVWSLGNDSPSQPDDRFRARPGFNFNDASMGRIGLALIFPLGRGTPWSVEGGYNHWHWGRSARRYQEPYLTLGFRF